MSWFIFKCSLWATAVARSLEHCHGSLTEGEGSAQFELFVLSNTDQLLVILKIIFTFFKTSYLN
jgi:hypothetical protein